MNREIKGSAARELQYEYHIQEKSTRKKNLSCDTWQYLACIRDASSSVVIFHGAERELMRAVTTKITEHTDSSSIRVMPHPAERGSKNSNSAHSSSDPRTRDDEWHDDENT